MKIAMIAGLWIAIGVAALPVVAVAHADTSSTFLSPSGNIGCTMEDDAGGRIFAVCKVQALTWTAPPSEYCQQAEVPGATGGPGSDLQLLQGKTPCVGPNDNQFFFPPDPLANHSTLGYGQTRSIGSIVCVSEQAGVTCTDSSTGHFFHAASDSYQLG
jgi:hypothetical protein